MNKPTLAIIEINFTRYVLPIKDAITVSSLLACAEVYKTEYVRDPNGGSGTTFYKIMPQAMGPNAPQVLPITQDFYNACKLAGEREPGHTE